MITVLSAAKGEENLSGMIFVVGAIIVILLAVGMGSSMLSAVNVPLTKSQNVSKSKLSELASLSERCWRKSGKGSSMRKIDCFKVQINGTDTVSEEQIETRLQDLPASRFNVSQDFRSTKMIEAKVSYLPRKKMIVLSKIRALN